MLRSPSPAARPPPRSTRSSRASTSAAARPSCARSAARRSPPPSPTSPRWAPSAGEAYVVLGAPADLAEANFLALLDGLLELAAETGTTLAGGDVTRAPALTLAVTVVGHAPAPSASSPAPAPVRRPRRPHRGARRRGGGAPPARAARPGRRGTGQHRRASPRASARPDAATALRPRPCRARERGR